MMSADDAKGSAMGHLMIKCPKTGDPIFTGLTADKESFAVMPVFFGRVLCPTCGAAHEWFARDAWVHDVSPARSARFPARPKSAQHPAPSHSRERVGIEATISRA